MNWWMIAAFLGVAVLVVSIAAGKLMTPPAKNSVFEQRDALFTAAERSFLGVLDHAVGERYRVFGKVRVADVIQPAKGLNKQQWAILFNQIRAKHFDFVLCDPRTLDVKFVIELNDSSHRSQKRAVRDRLVRNACDNAELALLEVKAKRAYATEEIRALLDQAEQNVRAPTDAHELGRIEPTL
jgi:hypothetical protein